MQALPALSRRRSLWAPTVLQGPQALHTDHLPAFREGATHSTQPGLTGRSAPISHGGGTLTETLLPSPGPLGLGGIVAAAWTNQWVKREKGLCWGCIPPHPACPPAAHPWEGRARDGSHWAVHTDLGVASHVVHINAQEVAEPVRHEHGSQVGLEHGVDAATQDTNAGQLFQVDAVGQAVHVRPPNTCGSKGGCSELRREGLK